jgi:hypothetical protein
MIFRGLLRSYLETLSVNEYVRAGRPSYHLAPQFRSPKQRKPMNASLRSGSRCSHLWHADWIPLYHHRAIPKPSIVTIYCVTLLPLLTTRYIRSCLKRKVSIWTQARGRLIRFARLTLVESICDALHSSPPLLNDRA